jgi:hypothetical protein
MEEKEIWKGSPSQWTSLINMVSFIKRKKELIQPFKITLLAIIMLIGSNVFAQEQIVKSISGSGGKNTRPFSVNKGWEIQWDAKGDIFQLYLYSADGTMIGVPANQQGAGKGNSYQAQGGKYYLKVNAMGNWTIKIVQISSLDNVTKKPVKENKSEENIETFSGSGGKNTRPFTVPSGWEIQWDAKGDIFQLYLYSADGTMIGVPANQQGVGKGNSYQAKGGKYYLQVNAMGNWTIKIVKVK